MVDTPSTTHPIPGKAQGSNATSSTLACLHLQNSSLLHARHKPRFLALHWLLPRVTTVLFLHQCPKEAQGDL